MLKTDVELDEWAGFVPTNEISSRPPAWHPALSPAVKGLNTGFKRSWLRLGTAFPADATLSLVAFTRHPQAAVRAIADLKPRLLLRKKHCDQN
jgi:hypothetical protein